MIKLSTTCKILIIIIIVRKKKGRKTCDYILLIFSDFPIANLTFQDLGKALSQNPKFNNLAAPDHPSNC